MCLHNYKPLTKKYQLDHSDEWIIENEGVFRFGVWYEIYQSNTPCSFEVEEWTEKKCDDKWLKLPKNEGIRIEKLFYNLDKPKNYSWYW